MKQTRSNLTLAEIWTHHHDNRFMFREPAWAVKHLIPKHLRSVKKKIKKIKNSERCVAIVWFCVSAHLRFSLCDSHWVNLFSRFFPGRCLNTLLSQPSRQTKYNYFSQKKRKHSFIVLGEGRSWIITKKLSLWSVNMCNRTYQWFSN